MRRIVLASQSPRRRQLLASLGVEFTVMPADIDESVLPGELPKVYVRRLAEQKAAALVVAADDVVIAADTTVDLAGEIMAKPEDRGDAERMLRALSGAMHEVHTGICVRRGEIVVTDVCTTMVIFDTLTDEMIGWYLDTDEPYDKAGAYALQGSGGVFVVGVEGSVTNVVGLPLPVLVAMLAKVDVEVFCSPLITLGR